jgi:hypothetical protein
MLERAFPSCHDLMSLVSSSVGNYAFGVVREDSCSSLTDFGSMGGQPKMLLVGID